MTTEKIESDTKNLYDYTNPTSVVGYVGQEIAELKSNEQPYLLILYGPPASGKTTILPKILDNFGLDKNYIYLSDDKFSYDTVQYKEMRKTDLTELQDLSAEELDDHPIIKHLQEEYNKIRKKAKQLLYMFMGLAFMYKYNVILEMTGVGLDWYMSTVIDEFYHYKYDIYLMYPFTTNEDLLYRRSIKRAFEEKRFPPMKYFKIAIDVSIKNFNKILDESNITKFKSILVYDTKRTAPDGHNLDEHIIFQYDRPDIVLDSEHFRKILVNSMKN